MFKYTLAIYHASDYLPTKICQNDLEGLRTMAKEITGEPFCQGWELFSSETGEMIATSEDQEGPPLPSSNG